MIRIFVGPDASDALGLFLCPLPWQTAVATCSHHRHGVRHLDIGGIHFSLHLNPSRVEHLTPRETRVRRASSRHGETP